MLKAFQALVLMSATYMLQKGFSALSELKSKRRIALKCVDFLKHVALEKDIDLRLKN